jgi:hypothetical protein
MAPTRKLRNPFTTDGIWNAVLLKIVASRHFAAEAVAARGDRHLQGIVGCGLYQHWNVQIGESQRICNRALLAKVRQGDDDAVDSFAIAFEQIGAAAGFLAGLDGPVLTFVRGERHHIYPARFQYAQHVFSAALGQMIGEESAVAHDHAHRHPFLRHAAPLDCSSNDVVQA